MYLYSGHSCSIFKAFCFGIPSKAVPSQQYSSNFSGDPYILVTGSRLLQHIMQPVVNVRQQEWEETGMSIWENNVKGNSCLAGLEWHWNLWEWEGWESMGRLGAYGKAGSVFAELYCELAHNHYKRFHANYHHSHCASSIHAGFFVFITF